MDIQRLLKKRQLNVQEQNILNAYKLACTARSWRDEGMPQALLDYAQSQGVDWSATIVLKLEIDFPGMPSLFGLLLTQDERFIDFEIETDTTHRQIEAVECWKDITATLNHSTCNRGIGKGFAAIALQVRRQLLDKVDHG
ncbi:hypothetical protein GGD92_02950 [Pseudomonas protegens]|uniref:Uncharacterized protein n=1 Tax=Pseudomonas protegens TaxID=380021 RepID=A0A7G7XBA9_9PSED|nr:hypothetical protein [Pseudomonas protegens]QNH77254.1 hypothetical protein GGI48_29085 [Pseudomonas protegens]QNL06450.1 hypothetical protein GGD92_02950 [Pseudomonas protegens]